MLLSQNEQFWLFLALKVPVGSNFPKFMFVESLFSCCSSAKGGVAILFNNNFSFKILRLYSDSNGRFIICDIETEGRFITLATLYAPNEDEPRILIKIKKVAATKRPLDQLKH